MKVIDTGQPYRLGDGPGEVVVGVGPVLLGIGQAGQPLPVLLIGRPMPMSLFQFTGLDGLPRHRIGPSSLHLCDGGIVQTLRKTIALRMQN